MIVDGSVETLVMKLPRDWQLLVAGAKLTPTTLDSSQIADGLRDPLVDWNQVVDAAYQHDIAPLMYRTIQPLIGARTAPPWFGRLKAAYLGNAIRNALLFRELRTLLESLVERDKPVIALKGAALVETVYRDHALRPMSDVDLLVRKEDLSEVEEILVALGYTLDEKQRGMKEWYYSNYHHLAFRKRVSSSFTICCEIHWHLERPTRPFPIDTQGVWQRAVSARVAGVPVLILCPEDLLLHLCLHTCKHRLLGGFRAFCDIAEVVVQFGPRLDWQQFVARAAEWRIENFVVVPLRLTELFLGAPVPKWVPDALATADFDDRVMRAATARVLEERLSGSLFTGFFRLRHGRSVGERAAVVRKLFSRAAIARRYPASATSTTIYRYYPRRLKDLIVDYGTEMWRFLRLGRDAVSKAEERSRLSAWLAPFGKDGTEDDS